MDPENNQSQNNNQNNSMPTTPTTHSTNTVMAILSYLGPLVIVSYFTAKDDPFVKFHIKQGLVLLVIEILIWILGSMFYSFWMILNLLNLATFILSILGIVNAANAKQKELPVVGGFAKNFNF